MSLRGRTLDIGLAGFAVSQLVASTWLRVAGDRVTMSDGRPLGTSCMFHNLFGVDCPFCGLTRSFVSLAHGQIGRAFEFHPAGPLLFVAMLVFIASVAYVTVRRVQPLVERKQFLFTFQTI